MSETVKTKIQVPLIGKLAVKHKFITKDQLKRSLIFFQEARDEGKQLTLPEIFIRTETIIPDDMKKLHQIKDDYEAKQQKAQLEKSEISLMVSEDKLKVELIIPENFSSKITSEKVLEMLKLKGITSGIVKEYEITNYINDINEYGKPKIVARGTPVFTGEPPVIECFFNPLYYRDETLRIDSPTKKKKTGNPGVEEGDLLMEKTLMIPPDSGITVFGETINVEQFEDVVMRAGIGTELFEEELKIVAGTDGIPALSVEGRVNVYKTVTIAKDYGVLSGPVENDSNMIVKGIITGEYAVRGGCIVANEIRNADIEVLGDINVDIGITGSVIRCQGDVKARYIHGSSIETYGSVITEKEIIDSKILVSGVCISKNSKIIASEIAAKRGIKTRGIGTLTSIPCEFVIGVDKHSQSKIDSLEEKINTNIESIEALQQKIIDVKEEQQIVNKNIISLVDLHKQAGNAIAATENNIAVLELKEETTPLINAKQTLVKLKRKNHLAVSAIREKSDMLQDLGSELEKIPLEIKRIENENVELKIDKDFIQKWMKKNECISVLEVKGDIAAGTIISGGNSTFELDKKKQNVRISEEIVKKTEPVEWGIKIKKL